MTGEQSANQNRVAIYSRVSTTDKGQDVGMQLSDLEAYTKARDWTVRDKFVDEGISGSQTKRPALDRLLSACRRRQVDVVLVWRRRQVDVVLVWRLDRLGRSLKHLIMTLDEFQSLGVAFVSLHEQLDCTTATGQLLLHLLGAFAEFERAIIRERVKAGLANARIKGKRLGRPSLGIDHAQVKSLRTTGHSIRTIARTLHVSPASVHKTLSAVAS